jgi:hypothetical protein
MIRATVAARKLREAKRPVLCWLTRCVYFAARCAGVHASRRGNKGGPPSCHALDGEQFYKGGEG